MTTITPEPVTPVLRTTSLETQHAVEQFLYAEAQLLDQHRYTEWLELFTPDSRYWIPSRTTRVARERDQEMAVRGGGSLVEDDFPMLAGRVRRVTSGKQWSEEPPSRTRRLLTNVRVSPGDGEELAVQTNFYVYRSRLERHQDWFVGERFDTLRPAPADTGYPFQIADRRIVFEQTTILSPSISLFF